MSFLDNLENNLKALESRETDNNLDQKSRRDSERRQALAAAPWADQLKTSPWTKTLMQQATRAGFQRRIKVHLIWIGSTLRLEALAERLELRPAENGVTAVFLAGIDEISRHKISLDGDPQALLQEWMAIVDAKKRLEDEKVRQFLAETAATEEA